MTKGICFRLSTSIALLAAFGCGSDSPRFARVSGVVMLDGVPYPNAVVNFQPVGDKDNPNPGRGSGALTDAAGKFDLVCVDGSPRGAVVGKHRVRIKTKYSAEMEKAASGIGSADNAKGPVKGAERIPNEWFDDKSEKFFDVTPEGTDKADFNIETKKKK